MTNFYRMGEKGRNVTKLKIGNGSEAFKLSTLVWDSGDIEYILWDNEGEQIPVIEWALGVALVGDDPREFIIGCQKGIFHPAIGQGHFFATLIALASKYQESQF